MSNINTIHWDNDMKTKKLWSISKNIKKELEELVNIKGIIAHLDKNILMDMAIKYGYGINHSNHSSSLYLSKRDEEDEEWINLRISDHYNHLDNNNVSEYVGPWDIVSLQVLNRITDFKFFDIINKEIKERNLIHEKIKEKEKREKRINEIKESRILMKLLVAEKDKIKEIKEKIEKKLMSINTHRSRRALDELQQLNTLYKIYKEFNDLYRSCWHDLVSFDLIQEIYAMTKKIEKQKMKILHT